MKKPNHLICLEIVKANPEIKQQEVSAELKKRGYLPASSPMISNARKKLGIFRGNARSNAAEIKINDVIKSGEIASTLGISIKETIETIDFLSQKSLDFGGMKRMRDALEMLGKIKNA